MQAIKDENRSVSKCKLAAVKSNQWQEVRSNGLEMENADSRGAMRRQRDEKQRHLLHFDWWHHPCCFFVLFYWGTDFTCSRRH